MENNEEVSDKTLERVLDLQGFYREDSIDAMTSKPGVYFVFLGLKGDRGCSIRELIYIGKAESQGVCNRLQNHEKMPQFKDARKRIPGSILYFAQAECLLDDVNDVEASLIKYFDPEMNKQCVESFNSQYDNIRLSLTGAVPVIFANHQNINVRPDKEG